MSGEKTPLFSVIVPVYRVEGYLPQCVESILGQSFGDFEVILVDDGSPDGSGGLCDEYARRDPRVRVVHKENGGLVSARKAGARLCTGSYVVSVDSDDYIAPELLRELSGIIDRHRPDVVTFEGYQFSGDALTPFSGTMEPGIYRGMDMATIRGSVIHNERNETAILYGISMKAIRRELYLKYQLPVPEEISTGEDLAVTGPLLAVCGSVYVSGIHGYYYRTNPTSIMNTFRETEAEQIRALAAYLDGAMGPQYTRRIDNYVLLRCFDFLDRGMLARPGMGAFRDLARRAMTKPLQERMRRAVCPGTRLMDHLTFRLMRSRCYRTLWLLRRVKPRK